MKDQAPEPAPQQLVVLTPLFNDWRCLPRLARSIENALGDSPYQLARLIVINDSSTEPFGDREKLACPHTILNLNINLGHQRAISVGLAYVFDQVQDADLIVVMDSDGEDDPAYIPQLCARALQDERIVFAQRTRRSESRAFLLGYFFYKVLFKLLTSRSINFGNFSCIPAALLPRVVSNPDLWNHYTASVIRSKIVFTSIPTIRAPRFYGASKMNFHRLVLHAFSSIAVYLDLVIARLLVVALAGLGVIIITALVIVCIRLFTTMAIPGWTSSVLLALLNLGGSIAALILLLFLTHLNQRKGNPAAVPSYYQSYIHSIDRHP